jgi:threonine dehydrogenase-like Zn-dependent dehydrogenase
MKTRRMMLTGPRTLELQEAELRPDPGCVIVKVASWGICNSEIGDWTGHAPSYPSTIGHEWAGTAVQVGAAVSGVVEGDIVTGLGAVGLADYVSVPAGKCYRLSPGVDPMYAMCEPLKCVVTVLRAAAPEPGDVGVVLGCGPMGLWCVQALAGNLLSALIAVDVDDSKLELAKRFGATHVINPGATDATAAIAEISRGRMADFIIEGTGSAPALHKAAQWLKKSRGRLTLMSMYKGPDPDFDFREIMNRCAEIRGVFPAYSADERDDMLRAVALLERGVLNIRDLVSHRFSLEDSAAGYNACENKTDHYIKGIIIA